jgi:hypothetical protein
VDNSILTQSFEYEIKSWTPQEITAVYDGAAGTFEIRIDRVKKVVTMIDTEKAEVEGARAYRRTLTWVMVKKRLKPRRRGTLCKLTNFFPSPHPILELLHIDVKHRCDIKRE